MNYGKSINLFLIDSDVTGRIKATLSNWTGEIYKIPRRLLEVSKSRESLEQTGVYILLGKDRDGKDLAYIGQANERKNGFGALGRILEHTRDTKKDFFNEALIITTSNNSFGPTEVSYLENRLSNIGKEANRYSIQNGNEPNLGNVTEEKISELEEFIEYTKLVIGAMGYKIFVPLVKKEEKKLEDIKDEEVFYLNRTTKKSDTRIFGKMKVTNEGYVVLKGSVMEIIDSNTITENQKEKRKKVKKSDRGELLEDVLFTSPSGASSFLIGATSNGWTEWKNKDGIILKDFIA